MTKVYYRIIFNTKTALSIGNGKNEATDKDIVKDVRGIPYIPGTSLAGIYRTLFDKKTQNTYFGNVSGSVLSESKIIVYDATVYKDSKHIVGKRDCVSLNDNKVAKKGAKFDFEILEPGVSFVTYIEQNSDSEEDIASKIVEAYKCGNIKIGGKTQRGLGHIELLSAQKVSFDLRENLEKWIEFDVYNDECWKNEKDIKGELSTDDNSNDEIAVELKLKQEGPISIRVYTTEVNNKQGIGYVPDQKQLAYIRRKSEDESDEIPVIPGTSWAGCFMHNMKKLGYKDSNNNIIFGSVEHKSKIYFSESEIVGATPKIVVRNAIDRFTGGCVDGALFTEKVYYGGTTNLVIKIPKIKNKILMSTLAATISDLHYGFVTVGGESSIGHGLFSVSEVKVKGKNIEVNGQLYENINTALIQDDEEVK